ncbi:MBOAT family O-acyltransferase [Catalinimonas alkaloidigena]|uniref:MBOAT family O-acyltransferase n=1 Tax=Catalinimonas alkaloidigena TaxID=1075417 RepID=UPI0024056C08|nr:MBOAT family O-acyltransferase [Catalinimonas alkaloidigena]
MLPRKWRSVHLLVVSYVFYGYWDWRFCSLLALSTIVDFVIGRNLHSATNPKTRKFLLWTSLGVNLGILAFFKYFNFFVGSFESMISGFGWQLDYLHLNIILPVGISFYTFQTMSYTIDIYRKKLEPTHSLLDFGVFVAFFPQLVAGPIERAKHLLPQITHLNTPSRLQIREGIALIIIGLFKKVMIGDASGRLVDRIFGHMEQFSSLELIVALVLFSIQIYADFSGYSSIARGLAKLLGIELMKNFEQPYLSANITEFWRRWHISLSSWLRDYLYISLGGNRNGEGRTYINLMLTMLIGGLWHGASWNFVIWGGLHGIYLAIHKWMLKGKKVEIQPANINNSGKLIKYLCYAFGTYLLVLVTWLFFRASDFQMVMVFFNKIINWEASELSLRFIKIGFTYMLLTMGLDLIEYYTKSHAYLLKIPMKPVRYGLMAPMLIIVLIYMFQAEPLPFVYFQF